MTQIRRMLFSVEGFISATFIGAMWLWIQPYAAPLVSQFDGPFSNSYYFMETAIPVLVGVYYLLFAGYMLYGPVQEERGRGRRQQPRRGRR